MRLMPVLAWAHVAYPHPLLLLFLPGGLVVVHGVQHPGTAARALHVLADGTPVMEAMQGLELADGARGGNVVNLGGGRQEQGKQED